MCGGGSAPAPAPDRSVELAQAQAQIRAEEEARRRQQEQQRYQSDLEAFNQLLGSAQSSAFERARGTVEDRGLDFSLYEDPIQSELSRIAGGVSRPVLGTPGYTNPTPFFSDDIADIVLDRSRDLQRRQYENQIRGFAPEGFALDLIPDTADDPILQSILTPQFEEANTRLQSAFNLGNLSRSGLDTARRNLEEQRTSALSNLNQVGGDVLSQGRQSLRDIRGRGLETAGAFELGQQFNPGTYQERINTQLGDFTSNLEGSIRNAIGSEPLFDVNRILASTRQSAFNPARDTGAPGLLQALTERDRKREEQRGVGNTGAF